MAGSPAPLGSTAAAASSGRKSVGRRQRSISTATASGSPAGRAARLAQVLLTRLSYANLKVSQGWIKQDIGQVEHLYTSRFKSQAMSRRKARRNTLTASNRTRQAMKLSPLEEEDAHAVLSPHTATNPYSSSSIAGRSTQQQQSSLAAHSSDGGNYRSIVGRTYMDHSAPPADSHYTHRQAQQYPPNDAYSSHHHHHHLYPHSSGPLPPPPFAMTKSPVPRQQASPDMYSYLVSPIPGARSLADSSSESVTYRSTEMLSHPHHQDNTGKTSTSTFRPQEEFWKAAENYASHSGMQHPPPSSSDASVFSAAGVAAAGPALGTPGVHAPVGAALAASLYASGAQQQQQQQQDAFPFVPPPSITPRPDASAPTFAPTTTSSSSSSNPPTQASQTFLSKHRREPSLRGDYSMSNVTMDDLDSHFGH